MDFEGGDNVKRPWVVKCNGKNYASFDTEAQAKGYIAMHMGKATACPKKAETYACKLSWTYSKRGE